jgi:tetratricopeptide (TPR) repeat protein
MKRRIVLVVLLIALAPSAILAQAPDQRERGLRVGTTRAETSSSQPFNLWAVLIGVSKYKYGDQNLDGYQITNLKNAADDAQAIYDFLKSPEGGGFRDESEGGHMILLKDDQATKANVEAAISKLKQAKPNDYFVLYIAAHGTIMPSRDQASGRTVEIPYFVLHDTDLRNPQATAMRMDRFQQIVSEIPATKGLVLSDTCHSGGVQLAGRDAADSSRRANVRYIEEMNSVTKGVGIISAADQLEQSFERDDLNQGVFTYCLLQGLAGNADTNYDGKVTFNEISGFLRDEVPRLTENKQHPKSNTTAIEANFLPLSVVSYVDVSATGTPDSLGLLVIRTPDVDGVDVAIDGKPFAKFTAGTQRAVMAKIGARTIAFNKGGMRREIRANVESGKPKIVEVNLTFSETDSAEDSLVEPTNQQLSVYLREEKLPNKEARDHFTKGVDLFNKQKFEAAIEMLDRAVQAMNGAYPDALVYRGRAEQSLGRKEAAVATFKAALQQRPTDFETQTLLAESKFNAGTNVEEVISELRGIIRRHPNFDYARVVYGDVLLSRREFARAEIELRRAVIINPKSPPAHLILADVLTYQDNKEKQRRAVEEAERAVALLAEISRKQTSTARGLSQMSFSHIVFGGGKYLNAPAMAEARHIAAKTLTRMVERDESVTNPDEYLDRARAHLTEALKLAEGLTDKRRLVLALDTSAQNHFLKGNSIQAVQDAERALKLSQSIPDLKDFYEAHYTLYQVYTADQDFAKAHDHLQKFISLAGSQMSPAERSSAEEELKRVRRLRDANKQKK